jgi:hypothetical protein
VRTDRDVPVNAGEGAMERTYAFCLDLIDALDADLAGRDVAGAVPSVDAVPGERGP